MCLADEKSIAECTIITGGCGCSFHSCCSKDWISNKGTCPGCVKPWGTTGETKGREKVIKRDPYEELRALIFAEELGEKILSQMVIPQLKEQTFDVATIYLSSDNFDTESHNLVEGALRMWEVL